MTLNEFKAWFEGFTENIDGVPNDAQWKRIQKQVKKINGVALSPTVIERHYHDYHRYWTSRPVWATTLEARSAVTSWGGDVGNMGRADYLALQASEAA